MEPSTTIMSASAVALPLMTKALKPICRFLFQEQPSSKSWRGQRLAALQEAGYEPKDLFFTQK